MTELVHRLNRLHGRKDLDAALAIGGELLSTLFAGDAAAVVDRTEDQAAAFRLLARHPDLDMSPTYLYRALHIAVQADILPPDVRPHLGISHHRELLVIPDPAVKIELARRSVTNGWSAEQLRSEVRELRPVKARHRVNAAIVRVGEQLRAAVDRLGEDESELFERLGVDGVRRLVDDLARQADTLRSAGDRLLAAIRLRELIPRSRRR